MIEIRRASPSDAGCIARTRMLVWRETYRGIYPDNKLDSYDVAAYTEKDRIHMESAGEYYFLFMDQDRCVGYFSFGPPHYGPFKDHVLCLNHLYILKAYQGCGLGRRAFAWIKEYCDSRGIEKFFCGCNSHNLPAVRFYEHMGGTMTVISEGQPDPSDDIVHFEFYTGELL